VKDDNSIVINEPIFFDRIKQTLFDNGFLISNSDSVFISTSEINLSGTSFAIKFVINKQDSVTIFKGFIKSLLEINMYGVKSTSEFTPVIFKGPKNGDLKKGWYEMDKIAKKLSQNISYVKR
jgi:virulence-associated protein VapD